MCLAQGDDMVDTLATDRSDQPFDEAVLPRRAWGNRLVTDAHGPYSLRGSGTVDTVPIADQVARSLTPRECLCDLACDPFRRRVWCDVDPDKVSANRGPAGLRAAHSTFAGVMTIWRAELVIPLVKTHVFITGTPNWALTVKITVPTPCTPPFRTFSAVECPKGSRSAAQFELGVSSPGPCLRIIAAP